MRHPLDQLRPTLTSFLMLCTVSCIQLGSSHARPVVHSVDSCIAEVVLVQLGHQSHRHEDHHFPDRGFTLQHPRCFSLLVINTPTNTARTELHSMITFHHANTRGSRAGRLRIAHLCVPKQLSSTCHVSFLAATDTDHKHKFSHRFHPLLLSFRRSHQNKQALDPYLPCDVSRQSAGSTQIPSLTSYEPKSVEIKAIETEAIEPEDLEPRRIEPDRNLGTDPYQIQERFMTNSIH